MPIEVLVMMGVQGSGKDYFIENNMPRPNLVASSDDFFLKGKEYNFDPMLLGKAHAACFRRAVTFMREWEDVTSHGTLVINNTNSSIAEIAPYMAAAGAYGASASILCLRIDPRVAAARNVHGVHVLKVAQMAEAIERTLLQMPPWWEREVMEWDPARAAYRLEVSKTQSVEGS